MIKKDFTISPRRNLSGYYVIGKIKCIDGLHAKLKIVMSSFNSANKEDTIQEVFNGYVFIDIPYEYNASSEIMYGELDLSDSNNRNKIDYRVQTNTISTKVPYLCNITGNNEIYICINKTSYNIEGSIEYEIYNEFCPFYDDDILFINSRGIKKDCINLLEPRQLYERSYRLSNSIYRFKLDEVQLCQLRIISNSNNKLDIIYDIQHCKKDIIIKAYGYNYLDYSTILNNTSFYYDDTYLYVDISSNKMLYYSFNWFDFSGGQKEVTEIDSIASKNKIAVLNLCIKQGPSGNTPNLPEDCKGFQFFNTYSNTPLWWNGTSWVNAKGEDINSIPATSGTFDNKPTGVDIGYAYFCTDKQTTEGTTNGIMIYYKGSNTWVDALGRVVS